MTIPLLVRTRFTILADGTCRKNLAIDSVWRNRPLRREVQVVSKAQPGAKAQRPNQSAMIASAAAPVPAPEPDLTPAKMIARACAMRATLRERQDQCESGGELPAETNQEFVTAGFYRTVQPRFFGGYQFDGHTFFQGMVEISRSSPSRGWAPARHPRQT